MLNTNKVNSKHIMFITNKASVRLGLDKWIIPIINRVERHSDHNQTNGLYILLTVEKELDTVTQTNYVQFKQQENIIRIRQTNVQCYKVAKHLGQI